MTGQGLRPWARATWADPVFWADVIQLVKTAAAAVVASLVDREHSSSRLWPVYGGLLINLRNILDPMDEVAAANPMTQPPVPFRRTRS